MLLLLMLVAMKRKLITDMGKVKQTYFDVYVNEHNK